MVTIDTTGVDAIIESAMQSRHLAGVALGIVRDGRLVYARGYGHADIDSGRPVTTATVFRIASISKTFTAVALMQLWEQNRFGLDEPVNQYLSSYKVEHRDPRTPPVTFRHLLTHTSGIGELRTVSDLFRFRNVIGLAADEGEQPSLSDYYGGRLEPSTAPDRKWAYANGVLKHRRHGIVRGGAAERGNRRARRDPQARHAAHDAHAPLPGGRTHPGDGPGVLPRPAERSPGRLPQRQLERLRLLHVHRAR
ncbi:MAG: beta-lactamase family protein [Chloroflexi bacterium]|nr:beta-lactamase family protein [Chloroflexota bacterium]